jgi:hypothetical protein
MYFSASSKNDSRGRSWTEDPEANQGLLSISQTGDPRVDLPFEFGKWKPASKGLLKGGFPNSCGRVFSAICSNGGVNLVKLREKRSAASG